MSARAATLPIKVYAPAGQDVVWTTELPVKGRLFRMAAVHVAICDTEDLRVLTVSIGERHVFDGNMQVFHTSHLLRNVEVMPAERIKTVMRSGNRTTQFLAWWEYEIAAVVG